MQEANAGQAPIAKREITVDSAELSKLLNRALNTMEPKDWPSWVNDLLGGHAQGGKIAQGMLTGATCTIVAEVHQEEAVSA